MLSWRNLHEQFGQEYVNPRDFKKKFRAALSQVKAVYPDARVERAPGGILLRESRPPLPRTSISLALGSVDRAVD